MWGGPTVVMLPETEVTGRYYSPRSVEVRPSALPRIILECLLTCPANELRNEAHHSSSCRL